MKIKGVNRMGKELIAALLCGLFFCNSIAAQEPEVTAAVRKLVPAVVRVTGHMRAANGTNKFTRFGESSGFFVDEKGLLLTVYDAYVAPEAKRLCERFEITFHDGRIMEAQVFAVDPILNFAVLKMKKDDSYPAIEIAGRPELASADRVWAIAGTKPAEDGPIFAGMIKAEDNSSMYAEGCGNELIDSYIKFPAISYGGPLVSNGGDLIGMNVPYTPGVDCQKQAQEEEHSVPIEDIGRIYKLLLAYPTYEQKWLGFNVHYINMDLMAIVKQVMNKRCGIVVDHVWPDGPAGPADIRSGDILVMISEQIIMTPTHFRGKLYEAKVDSQLELKLIRDGSLITRQVRLEVRPAWAAL